MASAHIDITWPGISCSDAPPSSSFSRMTEAMRALPSAASRGEDLWPVDEEAAAIWEARRSRRDAVQRAGYACMAAVCAFATWVASSGAARAEMMAWGSLGNAPHAQEPAVAVDAKRVAPAEIAPSAPAPAVAAAKPAAEAAPAKAPNAAVKPAAPARVASRPRARYLDDPYAYAIPAKRDYLADPY